MAGSQRAQLLDHWRPEDPSVPTQQDNVTHGADSRPSREPPRPSAPPRARGHEKDSFASDTHHRHHRHHHHRHHSTDRDRHRLGSPRRSRSRQRRRDRSSTPPQGSRSHQYHPSHKRSHSVKRRRSPSPSLSREDQRRSKRRRSPSSSPSISHSRKEEASRRHADRTYSPAPSRSSRRKSPDSYIPGSRHRRSPSVESYHRRPHKSKRHSSSRDPRPSSRPDTLGKSARRKYSESPESRDTSHRRNQSKPEHARATDTRSSRHSGRSPSTDRRRRSTSRRRDRVHDLSEKDRRVIGRERSTRASSRRSSQSPRPADDREERRLPSQDQQDRTSSDQLLSRQSSPKPGDQSRDDSEVDPKMRGYYSSGRPQRPPVDTRNFSQSPPHTGGNHLSPQGHAPYGGRGGWAGGQYPSHQGSPNGYSPNQPPYTPQSYSPNGHQGPYYSGQHSSTGSRGGYPPYRGNNHFNQSRGGSYNHANTHFSNMSWTPATGSRGGRAPIDKHHSIMAPKVTPTPDNPQPQTPQTQEEEEDNPFRPSKDLRVEDQTGKDEDKAMPPPAKASSTSTSPQSGKISFSLKSKTSAAPAPIPKVDLASKAKEPLSAPKMAPKPQRSDYRSENRLDSRPERRPEPRPEHRPEPRPERRLDSRPEPRPDHRLDYRSDHRMDMRQDHRLDQRPDLRSDYRDDRRYRYERGGRDDYGDYHYRDDYRRDIRYSDSRRRHDTRPDPRYERPERPERLERLPERKPEPPRMVKVKQSRLKAKPILPEDHKGSESVYYRRPGNESVVGSGTYGKVFKAVNVYTKGMVALKKIRMEGERDGFPVTAIREIKLLQALKHENVVCLQEVMVEKHDCFMVFEYLSHDLTGLLNHPTFQLDDGQKKYLAAQLFKGLDYLHHRGVLHRDIKAANILISNTGQLKLADFGLARFYQKRGTHDYTNRVVTIWYRCPELLLGETQYGPAVDIWSAACVLVEIYTKKAIFPGNGEISQLDRIYNVLGTPTKEQWPNLPNMQWYELLRPSVTQPCRFTEQYGEQLSPELLNLLAAMFQFDPDQRPSASDVLEHPYFTSEEPLAKQGMVLNLEGEWHELETKALRKREREERRQVEKRKAQSALEPERERKRTHKEAPGPPSGG